MSALIATDRLTAIQQIDELRQLRQLYRTTDWPKHCVGFYCLDNFVRWLERKPDIEHLHVFTLNGDWRREGLFLIVDRYQLFMGTINRDDSTNLVKALNLLDWSQGFKVSCFPECYRPAVLQVIRSKQLAKEYDSLTLMYHMPCEEARQLDVDCPAGFVARPLSAASDAETIDALWPNRHRGSLFLVRRLIEWNPNMGVYTEDGNELVAWCLRLQGGFLGALQVKDSHKRLGLGSLVARAIARRIAEMGHDVMALVNTENTPSRGMFEKLGFKVTDTCYWLRTYPTKEGADWPEDQ